MNQTSTFIIMTTYFADVTYNKTQGDMYEEEEQFCNSVMNIYSTYVERLIGGMGCFLNIICILVLLHPTIRNHKNSHMFKYLLLKSFVDALFLFGSLIKPFFICEDCGMLQSKSYLFILFYWVYFLYICFDCQLLSVLCEVAANFDRFNSITQKFTCYTKKLFSYKIISIVMILYSTLFYIYKFYEFKIIEVNVIDVIDDETIEYKMYNLSYTNFGVSSASLTIGFIHSLVRDCICVSITFFLNIMTILSMKKALKNKKRLLRGYPRTVYKRAIRAEYNLTIMVSITSFFSIFGHGLAFVIYLPINTFVIDRDYCLMAFVSFAYYMPYCINFFFYLLFNKNFKRALLSVFLQFSKFTRLDHFINMDKLYDRVHNSNPNHHQNDRLSKKFNVNGNDPNGSLLNKT